MYLSSLGVDIVKEEAAKLKKDKAKIKKDEKAAAVAAKKREDYYAEMVVDFDLEGNEAQQDNVE